MATRLGPISAFPATQGKVYPDVFKTASNDFWIEGLGVMASLDADAELHYVWHVPKGDLPEGTCKLEVIMFSFDADGDAAFNPKWKSIAFDEDMDLAAGGLNAEGESTISWTFGVNANQMRRATITLDADTVAADEFIQMRLALVSANWTLNQRSIILPSIIWE
jgi:hypothetical protein